MRPVIAAVCLLVCLAATEEGGNDSDDENAPPTIPGADIWAATPPPPPPGPTSAQHDFALASSIKTALAEANATSLTPHSEYTNSPSLARSMDTTPWKNRDRKQVTRSKTLLDDDTQLHEGNQTFTMAGSNSEKEMVLHMTRHGLFRRSDSKFAEFVSQPTGTGLDGYGLWRTWESQGSCPEELLVADPWGSLSWEAAPGSLRTYQCSWVVRPGMYLHEGYFKLSRAPISLIFRTFSLAAPHETLDIYDGAEPGAALLGRFTGQRLPDEITSTNAEVLVVIRADRDLNASRYWSNMTASIAERKLRDAQALFISAARSRLVGFYKQPMRRILRAIAIRLSGQPENSWMRRVWFSAGEAPEHGWDREYNASLSSVLQDLTNWDKRSRHDEGKDTVPWDSVLGTRRYPTAVLEPDRNPYHEGLASAYYPGAIKKTPNVDIEESVQLLRYLGFLDERPSGFSLDFTTSADCRGAGIAPYGEGVFPPVTVSSHPGKNFDYLPFPLQATSCQPMMISGPQVTRDRPYTVADTVMKTTQEEQLRDCLQPGYCDYRIIDASTSNCTEPCDVFLACVEQQMGNVSSWKVGRNMYNKSLAARGRDTCLALPEAPKCVNVQYGSKNLLQANNWDREQPKHSICLDFSCLSCAIEAYQSYADCATECGGNFDNPSPECIDCSYSFQDSYEDLDALRTRLWLGYLSGGFGYHICPECDLDEPGMMGGPEVKLTPGCRRCHYALEDFLNADVFSCLDEGIKGRRCFTSNRENYNFDLDFFGVVKPGAQVILTIDGTLQNDDDDGYNYGGGAG